MELKRQKTYKGVFDRARDELLGSAMEEKFFLAGLGHDRVDSGTRVHVPFFDETILFNIPGFTFSSSRGANVTLVAKIVILHYINTASGTPLTGDKVAYGDIPACMHYDPVFEKRVLKPLVRAFGYDRHTFLDAGRNLGAKEEGFGDASFTLFAFPKVPITFVLWEGDSEFPPSARALFDPSVTGYLPLEDIVVVSKLAAGRILKTAMKNFAEEV
ncbi:MAG TPA: DUF3786 domain-containing protein [Syntrophorhabdaceae bacterium]|nr:DUF3786 domain-containing protein [Syntrophorhabdaceae bacterium]HOD76413.1 DUF3786 domain-containing protein [Syntrophorhabdaceae bacterium]